MIDRKKHWIDIHWGNQINIAQTLKIDWKMIDGKKWNEKRKTYCFTQRGVDGRGGNINLGGSWIQEKSNVVIGVNGILG